MSDVMTVVRQAGNWLYAELLSAGASKDQAAKICMATGQRQSMIDLGDDPQEALWTVAREALERFKRGEWDEPGDELAHRLVKEKLGRKAKRQKTPMRFDYPD